MSLQPFELHDFSCTGEILGHGGFALVVKGFRREDNYPVAIKVLSREWHERARQHPKLQDQLVAEMDILRTLEHTHIVRLLAVEKHPTTQAPCLVLEYCDSGNLEAYARDRGGRLGESDVVYFAQQLALGLNYLQSCRVLHRDLKPENLLLTRKHGVLAGPLIPANCILKITDFGLAKLHEAPGDVFHTIAGTRSYMAPEIHTRVGYTVNADLWSVGMIVYRLLVGAPLVITLPATQAAVRIPTELIKSVSVECISFLEVLLQVDPYKRADWNAFYTHNWLKMSTIVSSEKSPLRSDLTESKSMQLWQTYSPAELARSVRSSSLSRSTIPKDSSGGRRHSRTPSISQSLKQLKTHFGFTDSARDSTEIKMKTFQLISARSFAIHFAEEAIDSSPGLIPAAFVFSLMLLESFNSLLNEVDIIPDGIFNMYGDDLSYNEAIHLFVISDD